MREPLGELTLFYSFSENSIVDKRYCLVTSKSSRSDTCCALASLSMLGEHAIIRVGITSPSETSLDRVSSQLKRGSSVPCHETCLATLRPAFG
ncbi:hypothetical protein L596_030884 [Steinernema carpocapsae]|uniref:Uncharacterized protein n=1 Tax=Steinernema carpocapsae TaxID=34508 RepID=A0A4U5LNF6_STECR|nr:hypothetical protein L596_030884 [Steinernema carpocapsae]